MWARWAAQPVDLISTCGSSAIVHYSTAAFSATIRGEMVELMPPVDSMELLWHDGERAAVESRMRAAIVGSDATVQAGMEKLASDTRADEVIVVTETYEHSDRIDSYDRVARIASKIKLAPGDPHAG